ncbi:hypothetical protein [Nocardia sp. NPDC004750]
MAVMKYHANVERGEKYWLVHVPEIDQWTQARNLREVDEMARDLIALMEEVDPKSFEIEVTIKIPDEARKHWEFSRKLHELEAAIKSAAAAEAQIAARLLLDEGLTLREIGEVLGLSHQRAGQLTQDPISHARRRIERILRLTEPVQNMDAAWPKLRVMAGEKTLFAFSPEATEVFSAPEVTEVADAR